MSLFTRDKKRSEPQTPAALAARTFRRTFRALFPFYAAAHYEKGVDAIRAALIALQERTHYDGTALFADADATTLTPEGHKWERLLLALVASAPTANDKEHAC